jgi:hypothetical protein
MDAEKNPQQQSQMRNGAAWIAFISQTLAASVEVFLHTRFGRRYLGIQALAALVAIPIYSLFWQGQNLDAVWLFFWLYLLGCLLAKADVARRESRGDVEHSYYSGRPLLMPLFRHIGEADTKRVWEPALVVLGGAILRVQEPPLGTYLMLAGIGLGISEGMKHAIRRNRVTDMNDAMVEQRNLMERFRGMRSGRR